MVETTRGIIFKKDIISYQQKTSIIILNYTEFVQPKDKKKLYT